MSCQCAIMYWNGLKHVNRNTRCVFYKQLMSIVIWRHCGLCKQCRESWLRQSSEHSLRYERAMLGLSSYPVDSDGLELFEGHGPGRFWAVLPLWFNKLKQSFSSHSLRHCRDSAGVMQTHGDRQAQTHSFNPFNPFYTSLTFWILWVMDVSPDVGHIGVPVEVWCGVVGRGRWVQWVITIWTHTHGHGHRKTNVKKQQRWRQSWV